MMSEESITSGDLVHGDGSASIRGCRMSLERCLAFLGAIDPAIFTVPTPHHGTIGAHLRHCLEYYRCFFAEAGSGVLEYDARERDPVLETDIAATRCAIVAQIDRLDAIDASELDRTLRLRQVLAPGAPAETIVSSVKRELMNLSDHTIHHLAILGQIAALHGESGVDPELGVAISTRAHRAAMGIGGGKEWSAGARDPR